VNLLHINQFRYRKAAAMLGEPAERNAWSFTPVTVDAQYRWALNAIEVPAGILAQPFFAADNPAASNYGGIGTVMAHELTHGFDDQGRSFDAGGALRDWWSAGAEAAFTERAQCLIDQFSSYSIEPGLAVDGELTLGENIADLGGVSIAYDALLRAHPDEPASHGYDARQQFFLEFAQLYCENVRPELLRQTLMSDPHSPGAIRVNGTLVNVPGFAKAFACRGAAPAAAAVGGRVPGCQIW
jgi:predicted metalloendopeptidase